MATDVSDEVLGLTQRLLMSIAEGDWAAYQELSDPSLTAIEPEAYGQLVEGLEFHQFYFQLGGAKGPHHTTMSNPHVRVLGNVAVVTYTRLNQQRNQDGLPATLASAETRIWHKKDGAWKQVHFHRSPLPSGK